MITVSKHTDIQSMKRLLLIVTVACAFPAMLLGQTIYIQNGTEVTLYLRATSAEEYRQAPPEGLLPVWTPAGGDDDLRRELLERIAQKLTGEG